MALRADDVDLGRDRDLVQRYQNGDPQAFDDLYRRYFGRLHRFCTRHTADAHEAEEVAQEAFVRAFRSMDRLDGERRFYPWMTVIAKRISIDRHRKYGRVELTDDPDAGAVEADLDHLFSAVDVEHVREAMAALGPRHREVLWLRESEELSYADIAERLDVPVTTVEALLHRARKALRREYAAVTGESRGFWGLPLLGVLGARISDLRASLGDRWAEIAAVAAPAAVAAVTAGVLLVPGAADDTPTEVETASAPVETTETTTAPTTTARSVPVVIDDFVVPPGIPVPTPVPSSTAPSVAPTVEAGPVDVFLGPEGAEAARTEAEQMPLHGDAGPAFAGVDPAGVSDDVSDLVEDVLGIVLGRAAVEGAPADPNDPGLTDVLATLLGGSR